MKIQLSRFGYRFLISLFVLGSILYVMLYMTLKDHRQSHSGAVETLSQHLDVEHRRALEAEQKVQELQQKLSELKVNPKAHRVPQGSKFGTLEEALMAAMLSPRSMTSGSRRNSLIDQLVKSGMTHSRFGKSAEEKILDDMLKAMGVSAVEVQVIDLGHIHATPLKLPAHTNPHTQLPNPDEHKEEVPAETH
jgi:citrate lyase gamma subunit